MTVDDIINSLNVIAYFNPSLASLRDAFIEQEPSMEASGSAVHVAFDEGIPVYDTLVRVQVHLANAVHDYTYNILYPHDSIIVKNVMREQVCRELFGIETDF